MLVFVEPDTNVSGVLSTMRKAGVHRVLVTGNQIDLIVSGNLFPLFKTLCSIFAFVSGRD
jgi:CBS domain-containing protein